MGFLPGLDSRPDTLPPDSPPELVSPGASQYSSRSSQASDRAWNSPPPTPKRPTLFPSMSNHEKPEKANMSPIELSKSRMPDSTTQNGPRQQLPSLSSLFGPQSATRPLNSPLSDRTGSYSATSPMDHSRLPSVDKTQPTSYFPRAHSPPVSQPRSTYGNRIEFERGQSLHSLPHSFSGSDSPKYRSSDNGRSNSRANATTNSPWSMQQETSRHEYSLTSQEAAFQQSPQNQFRFQLPRSRDPGAPAYPDHGVVRSGPQPPPTPGSVVVPEGLPSKDGLGPKIWTGTHFLPRFVRAAEVPGEGTCYFYDDGSHCKSVIDGEVVNAHWGVTKAGKPRKRLAIACVTCREKKIKCDPDFPRCVQCEKFGRICKFKNAPRGGHNASPTTPPAELNDVRRLGVSTRPADGRISENDAGSPISPRTVLRQHSPESGSHKRLRVGYDNYVTAGVQHAPTPQFLEAAKPLCYTKRKANPVPGMEVEELHRAWRADPYVADPHSTTAIVAHFFKHLDSTPVMRFLPEETFKAWIASPSAGKSAEDLMLLNSILAVGVVVSGGPKDMAFEYAQVAQYAQSRVFENCLQLAQCRMLLALYHLSISQRCEANDILAAAVGTAACLQLNLEFDQSREAGITKYPLGMNKAAYCESRRRTLWSLFMLERLNGMFPDRLLMINPEDVYVRLPSDAQSFEQHAEGAAPTFTPYASNVAIATISEESPEISTYLVEMVHIWSTNSSRVHRMAKRATSSDSDHTSAQSIVNRLRDWHSALPSHCTFSASNLETALRADNIGSFITMHLLYHHALIELNRHYYGASRSSAEIRMDQVQKCLDHAKAVIEIVKTYDALIRLRRSAILALPFMLVIVFEEAVDVLTATGRLVHMGEMLEDLRMAKPVVDAACNIWEGSCEVRDAIDKRLDFVTRIHTKTAGPAEGFRILSGPEFQKDDQNLYWHINRPMEVLYPLDMDIVYAAAQ